MSKPGYPIWWDATITIYNKYEDPQTNVVTWFKHKVDDCFWKQSGSKVTLGDTVVDSKSTICRIPKDDAYLDKSEWVKVPNDQMKNYFTLGGEDIIVKGDCSFDINEYIQGQHSTDLLNRYRDYQQCFVIEDFANSTGVGRNNEHYMARGK